MNGWWVFAGVVSALGVAFVLFGPRLLDKWWDRR
jgi:hypothetical protein